MRNAQILGYSLVIVGAGFIFRGYSAAPPRWWLVGAGVMFVIGGVIGAMRARRVVTPPA
jgi:hypothetical protein